MTDGFTFGDSRARDDLGGCCGKPVGCWLDKRGCVEKPAKAKWQAAAEAEATHTRMTCTCISCIARRLGVEEERGGE